MPVLQECDGAAREVEGNQEAAGQRSPEYSMGRDTRAPSNKRSRIERTRRVRWAPPDMERALLPVGQSQTLHGPCSRAWVCLLPLLPPRCALGHSEPYSFSARLECEGPRWGVRVEGRDPDPGLSEQAEATRRTSEEPRVPSSRGHTGRRKQRESGRCGGEELHWPPGAGTLLCQARYRSYL